MLNAFRLFRNPVKTTPEAKDNFPDRLSPLLDKSLTILKDKESPSNLKMTALKSLRSLSNFVPEDKQLNVVESIIKCLGDGPTLELRDPIIETLAAYENYISKKYMREIINIIKVKEDFSILQQIMIQLIGRIANSLYSGSLKKIMKIFIHKLTDTDKDTVSEETHINVCQVLGSSMSGVIPVRFHQTVINALLLGVESFPIRAAQAALDALGDLEKITNQYPDLQQKICSVIIGRVEQIDVTCADYDYSGLSQALCRALCRLQNFIAPDQRQGIIKTMLALHMSDYFGTRSAGRYALKNLAFVDANVHKKIIENILEFSEDYPATDAGKYFIDRACETLRYLKEFIPVEYRAAVMHRLLTLNYQARSKPRPSGARVFCRTLGELQAIAPTPLKESVIDDLLICRSRDHYQTYGDHAPLQALAYSPNSIPAKRLPDVINAFVNYLNLTEDDRDAKSAIRKLMRFKEVLPSACKAIVFKALFSQAVKNDWRASRVAIEALAEFRNKMSPERRVEFLNLLFAKAQQINFDQDDYKIALAIGNSFILCKEFISPPQRQTVIDFLFKTLASEDGWCPYPAAELIKKWFCLADDCTKIEISNRLKANPQFQSLDHGAGLEISIYCHDYINSHDLLLQNTPLPNDVANMVLSYKM